jgi:hypothetical protein
MFEVIAGDVFEVEGRLLTVFKLRLGVVGEVVHAYVHYTLGDEVKIRTAPDFCAFLAAGLSRGTIRNVNREADFA